MSVPEVKHKSIEEILKHIITEPEKMCGLTITDSMGVDVTSGLIHYMKQGFIEYLKQFRLDWANKDENDFSLSELCKDEAISDFLRDLEK
jgi:hypothetical protein